MRKVAAVVERFPDRELEIHRMCTRDPKLVEICQDYGDAVAALRHWERAGPAGAARAEEYRRIVEDLETEVLEILDRPARIQW